MNTDFRPLIQAAIGTLRNPRDGARMVMTVKMERADRWTLLGLITVVGALLAWLSMWVSSLVVTAGTTPLEIVSPFMLASSQLAVLLAMVAGIHIVGRRMGGTGGLDDAILLVCWIQIILIGLQIIQIAAVLVFPLLAILLGLAGLVLVFVLLTVFVAELHGFRSLPAVFFSVLLVMLVLATFIRFVFNLFGFDMIGII